MHAGNDYHFLYAALRAMNLIDRDESSSWISLEGMQQLPDSAKLDVAVGHHSLVELVQVKWTSRPDSTTSNIGAPEFWGIISSLWNARDGRSLEEVERTVSLRTNRSLSNELREQWQLLQDWQNLTDE